MVASNSHHTPEAPHGTAEGSAAAREPSSCASFQPYHQGQLDVFCAVYAVANALRSVHPLGMGQARRLFNDVLLDLSRDADAFRTVLYNATDHDALVRAVLECARRDVVPLRVERPFATSPALRVTGRVGPDASAPARRAYGPDASLPDRWGHGPDASPQPTPRAVWETLVGWLCGGTGRAAVLRFHRYLPFKGDPVISHWTAAGIPLGDTLFLHDSSRESNAIHVIERGGFVTAPEHLSDDRLVLVEPRCLYLIDVSV
ncbi:hypothetical protein [Nitratidesulfovibrio sp. SRB-5]|uniref:hypothetical protein n=1 Tax=Nitratidesulfovibrio sp. SRB-5 TaxID=2872636 RepID=UPI001027B81E|nr:hypothetical protein [Nitratidesulfovibrio sp. SRB-5]MBZ2171117.1 hypothetical protein [Nitratidesulfovibrio sp. SRB-5]RXF77955.1 hypothetical protein EKK70_03990 [Desulfovibrio sp. DS-1]